MSLSIPGETLHEPHINHTSVSTVHVSLVPLGTTNHIPDIAPEDEKSKLLRQTEEERQIVTSLHQIFSRATGKHMISSNLSLSQDFGIDTSRLNGKEKVLQTLSPSGDNVFSDSDPATISASTDWIIGLVSSQEERLSPDLPTDWQESEICVYSTSPSQLQLSPSIPETSGKHMFSSSFSLSLVFTIDTSRLNEKEKFDHTLFDSIDDSKIDENLQKCLFILQETCRVDHIDLTDSFIDSLCACLGGSDEPCCQKSFILLAVLYISFIDDSLQQRILDNLKDAFLAQHIYQAVFLIFVLGRAMRSNPETFSFSAVNWRDVSHFKTMDYNVRLAQMAFVRDAVILFRNRCSLDIFDPKEVVGRLVENYGLFSLTHEEIAKFSNSRDSDFLTSLFTSIIVFSITLNQTLPPRISTLYAATPTHHVEMGAMNHFRIPIHRDLGTSPLSHLILERFIRHRSEDSFDDQLIVLNMGVENNHFNTNSLLVLLHPFFISHLWHIDIATMMQDNREQSGQTVHILRSNFAKSIEMDESTLVLYAAHPPPQFGRFLDSLLTFRIASQPPDVLNFIIYTDYVNFCSPFGDGQLFQHIFQSLFSPLTPRGSITTEQFGLAATIRWLHLTNTWLPKKFDSPLLRFLTPSTLSNRRVTTHELVRLKDSGVGRRLWHINSIDDGIFVDYLDRRELHTFIRRLLVDCFSPFPVFVSLTLLALSNIVANTGPAVHRILCRMGTLSVVISSVSQSSKLEDYEAGLRIVSGLLRSLRLGLNRR
ncbi:hypothetical protein BLNAU_1067 [Blattamonas nauphoetae]|uniref:Uncharacterized protein n=1 Tax=Blattamonas nauphoetae TaxID=2049346 RepID=A0ABQ9YJP7_9EUKA|nr:hypothetical protein BLNAU_1067 [Blattamonas nauphoetae]